MIIQQTNIFRRRVKKMHKTEKKALDEAVQVIAEDPTIGDSKIGDLTGIYVFKYKHNSQLYLLAYTYIEDKLTLTFIDHGTHENFYRDLKRH